MEPSNANPIRFGGDSSTVTPIQNLILTTNVFSEPRGHSELGTSSQSTSSEVLVVIDEPSAIVSSDNATVVPCLWIGLVFCYYTLLGQT